MALILNIENAIDKASAGLAKDGKTIAYAENEERGEQASWIHTVINDLFQENDYSLADVDAVAVSNGPGSYTGLRIGLSSAKGICYALQKPLICINTLELIARSAAHEKTGAMICPMIDARRMEVFTAIYDKDFNIIKHPSSEILTEQSFSEQLTNYPIIFAGNGIDKWQRLVTHPNAYFYKGSINAQVMETLSEKMYTDKVFTDLAYAEPFYLKPVYIK